MRKSIKRIMATSAALVFAASSCYSSVGQPFCVQAGQAVKENYTYHEIDDTFKENTSDTKQDSIGEENAEYYTPEDEVTVIVSLKEDGLLEDYIQDQEKSKKEVAVDDYLATSDSQEQKEQLLEEQSDLGDELKQDEDIDKFQMLCHYTTVMNGFAAKIKYGDLDQLLENEDIETVSVAQEYEPLDTEESSDNQNVSQGEADTSSEYTGKGTTIAILDTGADITHEVFQGDVPEAKLDYNQILSCNQDKLLHVSDTDMQDVYKSSKIPFAFDYADGDTDVCPTTESVFCENYHGTHVASIAAGNETSTMTGVAKDAQLMMMKVFTDDGIAEDDVILTALEDSVVLGADVINMSLGSPNGFSAPNTELEQQIYDNIENAGISVMVSAGNSFNSSFGNAMQGQNLAENPDNGVIDSPASYASSTAVASIGGGTVTRPYIKVQGKEIPFSERAIYGQETFQSLSKQPIEYCVIPGDGDEASYEGINAEGKVVLVNYSDMLSFEEQIETAESKNAIGIMIANTENEPIEVILSETVSIPVIGIGSEDAGYLTNQEEKIIDDIQTARKFNQSSSYEPSEFSSLGVSPDLQLKPEIAAVGENVYAALPFGNYGNMSGTSMATPAVSGYMAVLKQYLNSNPQFAELSSVEKNTLATNILMSTANPLKNEDDVFYSPRTIGSGMADIENAVATKAYLYTDTSVEENQRPKLNLYDDPEKTGMFTSVFHLKNFGEESLTYDISYQALKEDVYTDLQNTIFLAGTDSLVNDKATLEFSVNGEKVSDEKIVVAPGQDVTVDVTFRLSEELKQEYEEQMKNGGYFEGYIQLSGNESVTLSLPFLGFYGDWTSAPIFDSGDAYNCEPYSQRASFIVDDQGYTMGINPFNFDILKALCFRYNPYYCQTYFDENVLVPGYDKMAVSPNGDDRYDGNMVTFTSLLRNTRNLSYEITDSKKNVLLQDEVSNEGKSSYCYGSINPSVCEIPFADYIESHDVSNNEVFTLTLKGTLDYDRHEQNNLKDQISYPITIDLEKPKVKKMEVRSDGEKRYIDLTVSDNQFVSKAGLYKVEMDNTLTEITSQLLNEKEKGTSSSIQLDISDLKENGIDLEECILEVYDYAMNHSLYAFTNVGELGQVENVTASAQTKNTINLSWNAVAGATNYQIYAYDSEEKKDVEVDTVTSDTLSYTVKKIAGEKLQAGTEYQFKIRAAALEDSIKVYGAFSDTLHTATCSKAVKLKVKTLNHVKQLKWESEPLASGYEVYRSDSKKGTYSEVKDIEDNSVTSYLCPETGKKYYYKVRTYKLVEGTKIYSEFSNIKEYKR